MEKRKFYAVVDNCAYMVETLRRGRLLHRVRLESNYPGGTSTMQVEPEKAGPLLDQFKAHKVTKAEYDLQVKKNSKNIQGVQKRSA